MILLLFTACAGEEPGLRFGSRVRVMADSLGPGWHRGSVGTIDDCVVVMIGKPPDAPVRLYPMDVADLTRIEVSDSSGGRWTPLSAEKLRERHPRCLS